MFGCFCPFVVEYGSLLFSQHWNTYLYPEKFVVPFQSTNRVSRLRTTFPLRLILPARQLIGQLMAGWGATLLDTNAFRATLELEA
jgi:hypothetical protein